MGQALTQKQMNLAMQQAHYQHQGRIGPIGPPILPPIPTLTVEKRTAPMATHERWLHNAVEAIQAKGRVWIDAGRAVLENHPSKEISLWSGEEYNNQPVGLIHHVGIPTKRLQNGDYVYVYPEDHHVPDEVLKRFAEKNKASYFDYLGY